MRPTPRPLRNLVVKNGYGQLGNRLYRLGNLIAFALEHRLIVYDFAFGERGYAECFENTKGRGFIRYPELETSDLSADSKTIALERLNEDATFLFNDEEQMDLEIAALSELGKETVFFEGFHFQADALTPKYHDQICALFQPEAETRDRVDSAFGRLRSQIDTVIGAHLRQGDFQAWESGANFFAAAAFADRCRELVALLPKQRVAILVFSDEPVDRSAFEGLPAFFSGGSMIDDLYSLSRCDYILAPPRSTFSGWSSYFGKKPIYRMRRDPEPLRLDSFQINRTLNNVK